jgi:hypothetical protein
MNNQIVQIKSNKGRYLLKKIYLNIELKNEYLMKEAIVLMQLLPNKS